MDDRDLEARLSARLHQRFDRAETPPGLSRAISDARLHARSRSRRSGVLSLLATAAVLVVAVVALGAWLSRTSDSGGVPTASPAPTSSPSSSPSSTPTTAPPSAPASPSPSVTSQPIGSPCFPDSDRTRLISWEGAAGSRFGTIAIQNGLATPCTISGTPGVRLIDGSGQVFLDSADLGAPASTTPAAPVFTLLPSQGNTIYVVVQLSNFCGPTPGQPVAVALVMRAGLDYTVVNATPAPGVTVDMAPCNGPEAPTTLGVQQPWSDTAP